MGEKNWMTEYQNVKLPQINKKSIGIHGVDTDKSDKSEKPSANLEKKYSVGLKKFSSLELLNVDCKFAEKLPPSWAVYLPLRGN